MTGGKEIASETATDTTEIVTAAETATDTTEIVIATETATEKTEIATGTVAEGTQIASETASGTVATWAPIRIASTTWVGERTDATSTSVS